MYIGQGVAGIKGGEFKLRGVEFETKDKTVHEFDSFTKDLEGNFRVGFNAGEVEQGLIARRCVEVQAQIVVGASKKDSSLVYINVVSYP